MFAVRRNFLRGPLRVTQCGPSLGSGYKVLDLVRCKSTYIPSPDSVYKKPKSKEQIAREKHEADLKSDNWIIRYGAIARSEKFSKALTKYILAAYVLFILYGLNYTKKLYKKDKELEDISAKIDMGVANEYELLRYKELKNTLRTRDVEKLKQYQKIIEKDGTENLDKITLENNDQNKINEKILPARDTTDFYEMKAEEYDEGVSFEEMMIRMGKRRKWLMKHCKGDVLEVACGTGRNIKYLDPTKINSITFLDASEKMMEITNKKFREALPNFKKCAFVVGKAEDLIDLNSKETPVKYDTVVEAFGLCSHHDPVKSLKNFAELLKPGGRIILLEHGRGSYDTINKILDDRAEKRLKTWGCRWNLDIGEILDDSGLDVVEERRTHFGTTWCIVAKRKGDGKKKEEIGFFEKYLGASVKSRIESFTNDGKKQDSLQATHNKPTSETSK